MKRIFFVEDDPGLMKGLVFALEKQGYEVVCARTLHEAEKCWDDGTFDLVILDVSLPDGTGFALCEEIRAQSKVPIIFLTAADEETDIIMGLDIGGDDYITKPFKLAVFLSRVNALLRRSTTYSETTQLLQSGGIAVDLLRRTVTKMENRSRSQRANTSCWCFLWKTPTSCLRRSRSFRDCGTTRHVISTAVH